MNFPHRNKQLWPSGPTSMVLTSRATETILTGSRTQDNFWELRPLLFNLLFKTYNFVLSSVLLPCLFPKYRIYPHGDSNYGQFLGLMATVSVISSSKRTILARRRSYIMLSFRATETTNSKSGQFYFFGYLTFLKYLPVLRY
jgi:hypothetical protein